ncbi:hypothetical protein [Chondrinema litorale]|uniref:hypothetical protein n=1 Tax=Chondrinema litorale TaxID=2994555 RepID=UPI0025438987|nr:hypothetical protein [Chondrinema litorale]UZR97206.1 hypothetical protein OQ292_25235 [Chondrinema litorale]
MNKLRLILFLLILSGIYSSDCFAQAWVQKKGGSYSQIAYSSIVGESKYNNSGDPLDLVRKVSDRTLQLYHEHGITDKLTVVGTIPIKFVQTGDEIVSSGFTGNTLPAGNLISLGNASFAFIYGLKQNATWVYSVQLRTDLNTASREDKTGLQTGVDAWGLAPSFHIGYGASGFWSAFDIGTNFRTNDYSTQFYSNIQLGTKVKKLVDVIGQFQVLQSFEDGNHDDGNAIETGLYTNNLEYAAYSLKVGYGIKEHITLWGAIGGGVSGNDVLRAPAFTLAVSYKR